MKKILAGAVGALLLFAGAANAQDYPTRPITVIVPFSAGGPTDTVARLVSEVMSRELKQQVLIENVGGAGGTLGAGRVAQAAPDGYTLLLHHIGMATAPALYRKLSFDPVTSFEPIGLITEVPMVIVGRTTLEPKTLPELITYLKTNKDKVTYANAGIGSASHLCGMMFMAAIDTQLTTVPYKGAGPAITDLIGGQVDLICDQTTNTTNQIKGEKIKAFAAASSERLGVFPDLPTASEGGLKDFTVGVWHGLYAPKGTPQPLIEKLSHALQVALKDENVVKRFAELGTTPNTTEEATPAQLKAKLTSEIARWAPVIKAAGVYAD
jgi:tripartite-type tricarboxylate transporter receptor subunit TctC